MNQEMQNQIIESTLKRFIYEKDGKKYVLENDLERLGLTYSEINFFENLLKRNNIEIVKEMVNEEDRPNKVSEYEYGVREAEGSITRDIPKYAQIEFDSNGHVIYEDYSKLDEYLEEVFLPENVELKKKRKSEDSSGRLYPFVQLNKIVKLKLSELEMTHTMNYLNAQGINVRGKDSTIEQDFENYDYYTTYKNSVLPEADRNSEALFLIYQKTKDSVIREQLILKNMRLVPWVAYKLSIKYGIDINELNSYGYEGLINAVEKFDPTLGYKFSTYAYKAILHEILQGIAEIVDIRYFPWANTFLSIKAQVEKETGEKIEENPELIDIIVDEMIPYLNCKDEYEEQRLRYQIPVIIRRKYPVYDNSEKEEIVFYQLSSAERITEQNEMEEKVNDVLSTLTEKEQKVLKLRFGFVDGYTRSLEQVAREFNLTSERIRQIEIKALRKLRHPARSRKIKDFDPMDNYDSNQYVTMVKSENNFDDDNTYDDYSDGNRRLI